MILGHRIRELRLEQFWTQETLAKKLNMAVSTISGYEKGSRKPDLDTLIHLASLFNVSVDYLVCRTNIKQEPPTYGNYKDPKNSIDIAEGKKLYQVDLKVDGELLTNEDKQYILAIIREKRNLNRIL